MAQQQKKKSAGFLGIAEILEHRDVEYVDVEMPEWKRADGSVGLVRIWQLTNEEIIDYTESVKGDNQKYGNAILVIKSARTPDGVPLFTMEHMAALSKMAAKPFNRLAKVALELNGVTEAKVEAAKND